MGDFEEQHEHVADCTPPGYVPVGTSRIRERIGMALGDFTVGQTIEHRPGRTVTETDHVLSLSLTGNQAPVHSDVAFCERTGREQVLVCGMVTAGIVLGASVRSTSALTSSNLSMDDMRFTHPVHVGDTIYSESLVLSARRSETRPEVGIVATRLTGVNQDRIVVVTFTRKFFVPYEDHELRMQTAY